MKLINLMVILSGLVLAVVVVGAQTSAPKPTQTPIQHAHSTTMEIGFATITDKGVQCSATAIAPHALLTATHCELPTDELFIRGEDDSIEIQAIERDQMDHTILEVDTTFKNFAQMSNQPVQVGDDVFIFGNPGEMNDILRKGYIAQLPPQLSKEEEEISELFNGPSALLTTYDLNGWFGDSGAAVFNSDGQIVGVISLISTQSKGTPPVSQNFMQSFPMRFTPAQIADAMNFVPKKPTVTKK
jgi:hypothetical protein